MTDPSRWLHPHILMPQPGAPRKDVRTPTDGKPFYCVFCGSGWNEYQACEDTRCELEPAREALEPKP
jgi:hypothetical protein